MIENWIPYLIQGCPSRSFFDANTGSRYAWNKVLALAAALCCLTRKDKEIVCQQPEVGARPHRGPRLCSTVSAWTVCKTSRGLARSLAHRHAVTEQEHPQMRCSQLESDYWIVTDETDTHKDNDLQRRGHRRRIVAVCTLTPHENVAGPVARSTVLAAASLLVSGWDRMSRMRCVTGISDTRVVVTVGSRGRG